MLNLLEQAKINCEWSTLLNSLKAIYYFLIGGRNGRKSTKIQLLIIDNYIKRGKKFILLRRKTDETVTENWFTPYVQNVLKEKYKKEIIFKKTIKKGERYTGYFIIQNLDGSSREIIGKLMFLSMEQKYKSNEDESFKDFDSVVFEEFIANSDKDYLYNEPQKLVNLISTVFRDREAKIYLIGNTLDGQETNPYFRFFELDDLELNVNNYYLLENEFKIKIALLYVANVLSSIPAYQKIKNNMVGTTGEWKENRHILNEDINNIRGDVETLPLKLIYRNCEYYIYKIKENGFEREYIYITPQIKKENGITNINDFILTLPEQHKNYTPKILAHLYPNRFYYSFKTHSFEFIPDSPKIKFETFIISDEELKKENSRNDNARKLELLNQYLYNVQVFTNSKSLVYWLQTERKEYIKNLIW
ncbi:MAG: phage DNA encapsidation protein [Eubacterium sp.]